MLLSELQAGDTAFITEINTCPPVAERLADLGFTNGGKISCVIKNRKNGPFAYRVRGTLFAVRKCDAEKIHVIKRSGDINAY